MWIKTQDGTLLNLATVSRVEVTVYDNGEGRVTAYVPVGGDSVPDSVTVYAGSKEGAREVMERLAGRLAADCV